MQRQLWSTGLSGVSLDGIARSAGLNRPSLAAAFGDKDAIYAKAASEYAAMMDERLTQALEADDLRLCPQGPHSNTGNPTSIPGEGTRNGCLL